MVVGNVLSPVPPDAWAEVLALDPGATIFQTPTYFDVIRQASDATDASRLYTLNDGRRLVVPLLRGRLLPGLFLDHAYPSGFGSGGLLAAGGLRPSDVRHVLSDLLRSRAVVTRLRSNHDTADHWDAGRVPGVVNVPHRVEVLDVDGGFFRLYALRPC